MVTGQSFTFGGVELAGASQLGSVSFSPPALADLLADALAAADALAGSSGADDDISLLLNGAELTFPELPRLGESQSVAGALSRRDAPTPPAEIELRAPISLPPSLDELPFGPLAAQDGAAAAAAPTLPASSPPSPPSPPSSLFAPEGQNGDVSAERVTARAHHGGNAAASWMLRPLLLLALTTPAMCGGYAAEQVSPDGALPIQLLKTLGALLAAFGATRVAQALHQLDGPCHPAAAEAIASAAAEAIAIAWRRHQTRSTARSVVPIATSPPWAAAEYDARCSFLAKLMAVASPDLSADAEKAAGKLQRSAASSVIAREWRSHRASTQEGGKRTSSCDETCAPDASMPEGAAEPTGVDSTSLCGLSRSITADGRSIWCFRQDAADLTSDGRSTQTPATEGETQTPKTEGAAGDPRTEAVDRAQPSRSIGPATPAVQPPQQQTDAEMAAEMPPLTPLSFSAGLFHDEAGYETGRIGKEVDVAMTSKMYENLLFPLPPVMEASTPCALALAPPPPVGDGRVVDLDTAPRS